MEPLPPLLQERPCGPRVDRELREPLRPLRLQLLLVLLAVVVLPPVHQRHHAPPVLGPRLLKVHLLVHRFTAQELPLLLDPLFAALVAPLSDALVLHGLPNAHRLGVPEPAERDRDALAFLGPGVAEPLLPRQHVPLRLLVWPLRLDAAPLLAHEPFVPHSFLVLLLVALPRLLKVLVGRVGRLPLQHPVRGVRLVARLPLPVLLPPVPPLLPRGVRPLLHPPGAPTKLLAPGEEPPLDGQPRVVRLVGGPVLLPLLLPPLPLLRQLDGPEPRAP